MPVGKRQREILGWVGRALDVEVRHAPEVPWLNNRHTEHDFGVYYPTIAEIFRVLGGDEDKLAAKGRSPLRPDGYLGGKYNCLVEFDEIQHFSSVRAKSLSMLPSGLPLGFSRMNYLELCAVHHPTADGYHHSKRTPEFDFLGGRTAQRAYFDCFRDILPTMHGLRPTVRISVFEVATIISDAPVHLTSLREIVDGKFPYGP